MTSHCVTHPHLIILLYFYSYQLGWHKNWKSRAALSMLAMLAQACMSWPIGEDRIFWRRVLKWQELKQMAGEYSSAALDSFLRIKACRPVWVVKLNCEPENQQNKSLLSLVKCFNTHWSCPDNIKHVWNFSVKHGGLHLYFPSRNETTNERGILERLLAHYSWRTLYLKATHSVQQSCCATLISILFTSASPQDHTWILKMLLVQSAPNSTLHFFVSSATNLWGVK